VLIMSSQPGLEGGSHQSGNNDRSNVSAANAVYRKAAYTLARGA
jgi:hypothetical protein